MEDKYQKYKNKAFTSEQWFVLKNAIDQSVDVKRIANEKFTVEQMRILIEAEKNGIDIDIIADPNLPLEYMEKYVDKISTEMGLYDEHYENVRRKWLKNITWLICISSVLIITSFLVFITRDEWMKYFDDLYIKLTDELITIEAGNKFIPSTYVRSYDNEADLKLPSEKDIDMKKPGTYILNYTISNGKREKTVNLIVNVVDSTPPELVIKTTKLTVLQGTRINPKEYITYAQDLVDGDLKDRVKISQSNNQIKYSVEDSSGNQVQKILSIDYIKSVETKDPPQTESHSKIEDPPKTNQIVPPKQQNNSNQEKSKDFPFLEGETFNEAYNRCMLYGKSNNLSGTCEPYKNVDGVNEGYRFQ